MKFDGNLFPHPVLGINDDVSGQYKPDSLKVRIESEINLNVTHQLYNPSLEEEIKNGNAEFSTEIHCLNTYFRKVYPSDVSNQDIKVGVGDIRGHIDILFLISAKRDFQYHFNESWHTDYKGKRFNIKRGMPLAYGGFTKTEIPNDYFAKDKGGAFIQILPNKDKASGPFEVILENDPLTLYLSKKDYEEYSRLSANKDYAPYFHSAIAVPALAHALGIMASTKGEQYSDRKWYQALDAKLDTDPELINLDRNENNALKISQIILKNPFHRMLKQIKASADQSPTSD